MEVFVVSCKCNIVEDTSKAKRTVKKTKKLSEGSVNWKSFFQNVQTSIVFHVENFSRYELQISMMHPNRVILIHFKSLVKIFGKKKQTELQ